MTIKYVEIDYGTGTSEILLHPDHYVAFAQVIPQNSPLAVTVDGRKIVKAGTFYPANDATAQGLVMNDLDVTDGDQNAAILYHGFIALAKLPAAPDAAAKAALPMVAFR